MSKIWGMKSPTLPKDCFMTVQDGTLTKINVCSSDLVSQREECRG